MALSLGMSSSINESILKERIEALLAGKCDSLEVHIQGMSFSSILATCCLDAQNFAGSHHLVLTSAPSVGIWALTTFCLRHILHEWREEEKNLLALNPFIQGEKILGPVYLLLIRCDQRFAGTSCLVAFNWSLVRLLLCVLWKSTRQFPSRTYMDTTLTQTAVSVVNGSSWIMWVSTNLRLIYTKFEVD